MNFVSGMCALTVVPFSDVLDPAFKENANLNVQRMLTVPLVGSASREDALTNVQLSPVQSESAV